MKLKQIRDDTRGNALVEFTVTVPFFLVLMFGLVQAGLLLYTQNGLQHGVEVAARCASVNYSAAQLNLQQSCFGVVPTAVTNNNIQTYAAQNSWGIVPSSGFTVNPPPNTGATGLPVGTGKCGTNSGSPPGYVVAVSHQYNLINYIFSMTLTATSCFPINYTS
jgi:Flp pilus assembly protein TadG